MDLGLHMVPEKHREHIASAPLPPPGPQRHCHCAQQHASTVGWMHRYQEAKKLAESTWAMSAHVLRMKMRRQEQKSHWRLPAQGSRCRRLLSTTAGAASDSTANARALDENVEAERGKQQRNRRFRANKPRQ